MKTGSQKEASKCGKIVGYVFKSFREYVTIIKKEQK